MQPDFTDLARTGTIFTAALCLTACASSIDRLVKDRGLERDVMSSSMFEHAVFRKAGAPIGGRLRVYIEGDGTPWIDGNVVAIDPTPKSPLALRLMLLDTVNSIYVGRPCYFGMMGGVHCEPDVWTFGRYSVDVVDSMAAVIGSIVKDGEYHHVTLIGYSGGGAIALLVASHIPEVKSVVTVAANLDTDEWIRIRGFLPLHNSLNPANSEPLPSTIAHVQLAGRQDEVVPLSVTESFRRSGHQFELWLYEDFDHRCCWERAWPDILERLDSAVVGQHVTTGE
jgi:pimeloyl-ACP methyl ester carboxylesterase